MIRSSSCAPTSSSRDDTSELSVHRPRRNTTPPGAGRDRRPAFRVAAPTTPGTPTAPGHRLAGHRHLRRRPHASGTTRYRVPTCRGRHRRSWPPWRSIHSSTDFRERTTGLPGLNVGLAPTLRRWSIAVSVTLDVEDLRPSPDLPERAVMMTHQDPRPALPNSISVPPSTWSADLAERRPGTRAGVPRHRGPRGRASTDMVTRARCPWWATGAVPCRGHPQRPLTCSRTSPASPGQRLPGADDVPGARQSAWAVPILAEAGLHLLLEHTSWPRVPCTGGPDCPEAGVPLVRRTRRVARARWCAFPWPRPPLSRRHLPPAAAGDAVRRHRAAACRAPDEVLWTYCHPWEFDLRRAVPPPRPHRHGRKSDRLAPPVTHMETQGPTPARRAGRSPPSANASRRSLAGRDLPVVDPIRSTPDPRTGSPAWANGRLRSG